MSVFASTLNQIMFLFTFIAIGYVLAKGKYIPQNSASVLSRLENNIFIPALVLGTFMENFTVERISSTWQLLLASFLILMVVIPVVIFLSKCVTKNKYLQNIYIYALSFSNFAFMGNAVVSALFPDIFFEYLIFTLPLWMMIYLWGVPSLLIADSGVKKGIVKRLQSFVNPMFMAMFAGMIIGLSGLQLPRWVTSVVTVSGDCMSPIAMLLTGMTVSAINLRKTFTDGQIYVVSFIRLILLPLMFVGIGMLVPMSKTIFVCALCTLAMPLGLNTIVIPSAYGKDTTAASGMALVSHLLSVATIPLIFMLGQWLQLL